MAKANPFNDKLQPDETLAAVIGSEPVTRPQTIKALWKYIKINNLQNPQNKREIVADNLLREVFGKDRATMFELSALVFPHLQKVAA